MIKKILKILNKNIFLGMKEFNLGNYKKTIKYIKYIAIILVVAASLITIKDYIEYTFDLGYYSDFEGEYFEEDDYGGFEEGCNVLGVELRGDLIAPDTDWIKYALVPGELAKMIAEVEKETTFLKLFP